MTAPYPPDEPPPPPYDGPHSDDFGPHDGGGHGGFSHNPGDRTDVPDASQGDDPCSGGSNPKSGNPIVLGTGNKVETEVDFTSAGEMPLTLERTYDHYWSYIGIFGKYWVSNLDYSITIAADESTIYAQRPDGRRIKFFRDPLDGNRWNEDKGTGSDHIFCDGFDAPDRNPCSENGAASIAYITRSGSTYTHATEDNDTELYDAEGRITRRTNAHGISWTFGYTNRLLTSVTRSSGRVSGVGRTMSLAWTNDTISVVSPDGSKFEYEFIPDAVDAGAKLLVETRIAGDVGNPAVTIDYHYEDARFPGALTGKSFNGKRYSTFAYDAYARVTDSKHAGSTPGTFVEAWHFDYTGVPSHPPLGGPADPPPPGVPCNPGPPHQCPANPIAPDSGTPTPASVEDALVRLIPAAASTVTETNPLGYKTTYTFANGQLTAASSPASAHCGARASARTYDAFGYDDHVTDFNGNVTDYDYAANGQLAQKVQASGSAIARTTSYTWDPARNRPLTETVKGLEQTTYGYSPQNRIASITRKNLAPYGTPNQT
ncbi:MAG TPA: RHS repeat domain-containing protein, partial [Rhodanobacteraceae bacterium]|nr:RHS repeat domain-containing protein [Rhodanobacteraceae bacterium]